MGQVDGKYKSLNKAFENPISVKELQLSSLSEKLSKNISQFENLEVVRLINLSKDFNLDDAFKKLSKLKSLKKLYLYGNEHSSLPKSLSKIKSLEFIELNSNLKENLSSIITLLSKIETFNALSLRSMQLTEIPENIKLLKLKYINLDNNPNLDLENTFELLSTLQLETINLSSSKFTTVPKSITKLSSLKRLDLEMVKGGFNNEKSFTILSLLPNLEELNIQGNFFGKLNPSVEKLHNLKLIEIDGNCIVKDNFEDLKKLLPNTIVQNETPC
ncbi:MAG: Leucine-rich repeat (LRR) protein [Polaribacter sp.]|jgi:Leucine-rich repeat (LRR) protein